MKNVSLLKRMAVYLAVVGICLPQMALAAGTSKRAIADVQLHKNGVLLGQVVTAQNAPVPNEPVLLRNGKAELAKTQTDRNGYFAFKGLDSGVYQVVAANGQGTYRAWTPGTAPPSGNQGVLIVAQKNAVRGQCAPACSFKNLMSNPLVIAGIVAAAIAIPIAVHNSRGPASP